MKPIHELVAEMYEANAKAIEASKKWNERNEYIILLEERRNKKLTNTSSNIAEQRLRIAKSGDQKLQDHFSAYTFHKGEVERISALLNGMLAYEQLKRFDLD